MTSIRAPKTSTQLIDSNWKSRGVGFGLRGAYFEETLAQLGTDLGWCEIITENYLVPETADSTIKLHQLKSSKRLELARNKAPVAFHGVSMNLGSTDRLDKKYLKKVKQLASMFEPMFISDHLCFTGVGGKNTHDLLPLPYTQEVLDVVASRVREAQDFLGQRILIENPSSYISFEHSEMSEAMFLRELSNRADCGLLLDVNNVYVSGKNHQFDAWEYMKEIPFERVAQIHLAGHSVGEVLIDTHDQAVCEPVWTLYEKVMKTFGARSTMIERDGHFVDFSQIEKELQRVSKSVHQ